LVGRVLEVPVGLPEVPVLLVLSFAACVVSDPDRGVVVVAAPTFAPVVASIEPAAVPAVVLSVVPALSLLSLGFEHATNASAQIAAPVRSAMPLFISFAPVCESGR
jgi:hypothetical protein